MTTLAIITDEYRAVAAALEDGECTPELEQALSITRENLAGKVQAYHHVRIQKLAAIDAANAEIERLKDFIAAQQRDVARLEFGLTDATLKLGQQKEGTYRLEAGTLRLSTRRSTEVVIEDFRAIPPELIREQMKRTPNKDLIKARLACGAVVPGARLQTNYNLSVR